MSSSEKTLGDLDERESLDSFPRGWTYARLDEIADIQGGITKDRKRNGEGCVELPYLRVANVQRGYLDLSEIKHIPVPVEKVEELLLKAGDVLFTEGGDRDKLGRGWVWSSQIDRCIYQNHIFRARLHDAAFVEPKFVSYFSNAFGQRYFMTKGKQTTNLASINKTLLSAFPIPLAPSGEQKRIVAEIEKQFSRLDEAVANLKRVQANLKRYKAAVLKAAVEGKLTEEWRNQHPDVEPADRLLARTAAAGGATWGPAKTSDPLPPSWAWTELGDVLKEIQAGKSFKCEERPPRRGERGVVKVSAVTWGTFDENESKTITDDERWTQSCRIREGDFLFSRANTIDLVGACVLVGSVAKTLMLSDKILRLEFLYPIKEWALLVLRSVHGRNEIESLATGNQESMRNIGQRNIRRIRLPFPTLPEQAVILSEVAAKLSVTEQAEHLVAKDLKRADRLRQSILQQAFSGQLVPQDANDEPASVLLERLRAERAAPRRAGLAPPRRAETAKANRQAPKRESPGQAPPRDAAPARPANESSVAAAILGFMKPGLEYFRSDVVDALGLTVGQWNAGIRELKESGTVTQTGERRGARYRLTSPMGTASRARQ